MEKMDCEDQGPSFADSVLQGLQETSLLSQQEDAGQAEEPSVSQEGVSKSPETPEQPEQALLQVSIHPLNWCY